MDSGVGLWEEEVQSAARGRAVTLGLLAKSIEGETR